MGHARVLQGLGSLRFSFSVWVNSEAGDCYVGEDEVKANKCEEHLITRSCYIIWMILSITSISISTHTQIDIYIFIYIYIPGVTKGWCLVPK